MTDDSAQVEPIMAVMDTAFEPTYGEAWNRRQVADALAMPSTHAVVIDGQGREIADPGCANAGGPAGFVLTRAAVDEEELLLIAVTPDCRRCGLGSKLIERLLEKARARGTRRIFLQMRKGNPAEHLYRAYGFEPIGRRADYYRVSDGSRIDAITFSRKIT